MNPLPKEKQDLAWPEKLLACYELGASDVEVCKELKITLKQFNENYAKNPKFTELVDFGRNLSHSWWMEQCRRGLFDKTMNVALWQFVMKNRFGWADKIETTNGYREDLNLDDVRSKLQAEMPKLLKALYPDVQEAKLLEMVSIGD